MPTVSVIIPVYNRERLLGETLESVRAQKFADWECIVVDDGSTDGTKDVVARYIKDDSRFRYAWQENSSASKARNRGLELARGEFVAFLDSDDLMAPDRLEWQVPALRSDPHAVLVYGDAFHFRGGDRTNGYLYLRNVRRKPTTFEQLLTCSAIYSPLVRKSAMMCAGGFDELLASAEDWDMWLKIARLGKLMYQPRIAVYYRIHEGNKSGDLLRNYLCARRVAHRHLETLPVWRRIRMRPRVMAYLRRGYRDRLLRQACVETVAGSWPRARAHWRALLQLDPALALHRANGVNMAWALVPTDNRPVWRGHSTAGAGDE